MRAVLILIVMALGACTVATDEFQSCTVESIPGEVSGVCGARVQNDFNTCAQAGLIDRCDTECANDIAMGCPSACNGGLSADCQACFDRNLLDIINQCSVSATDDDVDFECRTCLQEEPANCINRACEDLYFDSVCCFNSCEDEGDPTCERCADTFAAYEACATADELLERCNASFERCFEGG